MMPRRALLAAPFALAAACQKSAKAPAVPVPDGPDPAEVLSDHVARDAKLAGPESTVPADGFRTPPPSVDVLEQFPELKPFVKVTTRLHPRWSRKNPETGDTHFGLSFLWPSGEPWPECPEFKIPMAPVLQLKRDDAPPQFPFRENTDLMQLFWTPRHPGPKGFHCAVAYRKAADAGPASSNYSKHSHWLMRYAPIPCLAVPERVSELPDWATLMKTGLRAKLAAWKAPNGADAAQYWNANLSSAAGCKAGGWPAPDSTPAACPACKWGMDYLLTIADSEWPNDGGRWRVSESGRDDLNLSLPNHKAQLYMCRRCPEWPVAAV
jgi:hypothetical protein